MVNIFPLIIYLFIYISFFSNRCTTIGVLDELWLKILVAQTMTKIWFFFSSRSLHYHWKSWSLKRWPKFYWPSHFLFHHYIVTKVFNQLQLKHLIAWVATKIQLTYPPNFFLVLHCDPTFYSSCNLGRSGGNQNSVDLSTFFLGHFIAINIFNQLQLKTSFFT